MNAVKPAGNGRVNIDHIFNATVANYGWQNGGPTRIVKRVLIFEHVIRTAKRGKEDGYCGPRPGGGCDHHSGWATVRTQGT